jgi:hypothetical protein
MAVLDWINPGGGDFDDPDNFFPHNVPTGADLVNFAVGMGVDFVVTFPGNPAFESLAAYESSHLRFRADTVTFSGSSQVDRGPATYTVVSSTTSEADRGIVIAVLAGDTAVLDLSPADPSDWVWRSCGPWRPRSATPPAPRAR